MVWISIEGSIGSGKSTIVERLDKYYSTPNIGIYKEPIVDWLTYLNLFYSNKIRNAFLLQIRINTSFIEIYNSFYDKNMVITERSSYSSQNVFGKMLNDEGIMTNVEYKLTESLVNITQPKIPDFFIYLRTHPKVCYQRIIERGDDPIVLDYLTTLSDYHDNTFLNKDNVYVINSTNNSKQETFDTVLKIVRLINSKKSK